MKLLEMLATLGPSRRASVTVIEMVLQAESGESARLTAILDQLQDRLLMKLVSLGLKPDQRCWGAITDRPEGMAQLAGYACQTALALQRRAGHMVQFEDFITDKDPLNPQHPVRFIFEHDHPSTGRMCADLAMRILSETSPYLKWTSELQDTPAPLDSSIETMLEFARQLVTPPDVLDLVSAARERGIPAIRLERDPYEPVQADFRIAPNGLLMLGQSCHQVLLDGLFCIQRPGPAFKLMQDRRLIWRLLAKLGVPRPVRDIDLHTCTTLSRACRLARRVGYPLRVWPLQRDPVALEGWLISDEDALRELFARTELQERTFMVEPEPGGQKLELILANGRLLHARLEGKPIDVGPAITEIASRINGVVNTGLLLLRFSVDDVASSGVSSYQLTHLDPAPTLHQLLAGNDECRRQILAHFLDWLIPPDVPFRVPVVAITGTNGKTTTSTMISRIAKAAGRYVGMAQTGGVHFDGQLQEFGDLSGFFGHCRVFENPQVNLAVLETARGGIVKWGFTFDRCDVAVCTNVTPDHLGEYGIETVEDMAVIKRSVLERADRAVVLNGDDPLCLEMLPFLTDKTIYLSTFKVNPQQLRSQTQAQVNIVNLEEVHGQDWIVLHQQDETLPVIAVDAIPATFNGTARHNISNAMHAVAATLALGLDIITIQRALSEFEMTFEAMPGRLNLHDNGKYQVIMDYAHNADGIRQLVRFTDQYPCKGRRILRFGVSPAASDSAILAAATVAAGHFDHYVCSCKTNAQEGPKNPSEALKQGLIDSGVAAESISVVGEKLDSFDYPVSLCREGDLLVLVTSRVSLTETWQKILAT